VGQPCLLSYLSFPYDVGSSLVPILQMGTKRQTDRCDVTESITQLASGKKQYLNLGHLSRGQDPQPCL
jgi:hypothetical protein